MTNKQLRALATYVKQADPHMFEQLSHNLQTVSMLLIGSAIAAIDPEMTERFLEETVGA
jgi:hypothetical protein